MKCISFQEVISNEDSKDNFDHYLLVTLVQEKKAQN